MKFLDKLVGTIERVFNRVAFAIFKVVEFIYCHFVPRFIRDPLEKFVNKVTMPFRVLSKLFVAPKKETKAPEAVQPDAKKREVRGKDAKIKVPPKESASKDEESQTAIKQFISGLKPYVSALSNWFAVFSKTMAEKTKDFSFTKFIKVMFYLAFYPIVKPLEVYLNLPAGRKLFVGFVFLVAVFSVFGIYYSWERIQSILHPMEPIPSVDIRERPAYYKSEKKQLKIGGIRLPIFVESINAMQSMGVDITLHASNRMVILFLTPKEGEIRDRLVVEMEPFISDFSLKPEGKGVLKNKIIRVVNDYLKEHEVDGEIEDVSLEFIMGV